MFPVLFQIGSVSVSSFGIFLTFGLIYGVFLIWRLTRAWELDEEKVLDLAILTFFGGLFGARAYFVILNWPVFSQALPLSIIQIDKYPGLSFWGAFLGGWLTLHYFSRKMKLDFWQIADIASIGFLGCLILTSIGCFLGGCGAGVASNLFFAAPMTGLIGKRFPIQILEALLYFFVLKIMWSKATHFHQRGKVAGLSLFFIGLIKLIAEPLKGFHDEGFFLSISLSILGFTIYYVSTKRNFFKDLLSILDLIGGFLISNSSRKFILERISRYWYNQTVIIGWKFRNFKKSLRRLNVRFSFKNN